MKKEIQTLGDIRQLVDNFYEKVRADELLGPVFGAVIEDRWPVHLEKMYNFWQTVLLGEHTYLGSPFPPHAKLPINGEHFDRWLALFYQTLDEQFTGEKAEEARWRAEKMAQMFQSKIDHYRNSTAKPLV